MIDHAPLAPSSAARRMQCPGSRAMCLNYPEPQNVSAAEGELAHAVCAATILGQPIPPNATEEMLDGADLWMDTVGIYEVPHVEERLPCQMLHPDCWGTPDFWASSDGAFQVADYKFGHRYVEVFENWQLLSYAAGVIFKLRLTHFDTKIRLTLVQPRCYHADGPVRHWDLTLGEIQPYLERLRANCEISMTPDAYLMVGAECRDCSARHACSALQAAAYETVELSKRNVPFDMAPSAIGGELALMRKAADLLNHRISGLENEVLGRIKQGQSVPGWMTQQGQGREKWSHPVEEVIALGQMMGIDVSKPGAVTPKQAIKAGLPAELVRSYSETPTGSISLVPDTGDQARKAFA